MTAQGASVNRNTGWGYSKAMVTQVEELDKLLPAGPCADCGQTFDGYLLDDDHLCMDCEGLAYSEAVRAENEAGADAEDAALYKEGMTIWDKALAEAQVLQLAEDDLWFEEQWEKIKPEWEKQEAAQLLKHLEETAPWEWLRMRERAVKDRELTRRERRQDGYDAEAEATDLANVEPDWDTFDGMTMDVVRSTIGKLPAILTRTDGRTILYAGRTNTVAARPNGGKSWIAIKTAIEVVERGGRCLMLDFDNKRPGVLALRAQNMAVEATFQNKEYFQFKDVELVKHKGAMAAAVQWLLAAKEPTFSTVIIDSDTAAGVPNDGGDVNPWWKVHVTPWETAELGVVILSHRPKQQDEDAAPGSIGSQTKRALPTGAVLIMKTTKMWNSEVGGLVHLVVDKDRNGELPGVEEEIIVDMVVEHVDMDGGQFLNITLEPPDEDRGNEDIVYALDAALAEHPEGVYSQRAVRALVKGNGKAIGMALKSLVDDGHVIAEKVEGKRGYVYKSALFQD